MASELKLSACCCISHEFHNAAVKSPDKVAVIHASGFAQISREYRRNHRTDQPPFEDAVKISSDEATSFSHPPVYAGDECFTFADILSAVECLSSRLRRIFDGEDDPYLIKPSRANISSDKLEHVSETLQHSSASLQQSTNSKNLRTPKVVMIYMEPSVEYIVAVLSVVRCGEAFMPVDPAWPKARILSIISSSGADLVIGCKSSTKGNCLHRLDMLEWLIDDGSCPVLPFLMKENIKEHVQPLQLGWPCESENLRSFCYLMYTSGSSGKPKGVCGTEIGLLNRFIWMQELYPLCGGDLVLFKTPISFIDHLQEFLGPLFASCTLVIPPSNQLKENMYYVTDFLQGYCISRLVAVPSLMRAILPALQSPQAFLVQESSAATAHDFNFELIWEHRGPLILQKVTGDCTYFDCKRLPLILDKEELGCVPIGLPITNCDVLLDGEDAPHQGEIIVGGLCVAAGYLQYPYIMPLTDVDLSLNQDAGCPSKGGCGLQSYFKTGDFARKLPSGDLVFLGRKDRTLKLNGQRIALEEIESTLRDHPEIIDGAVVCHEVGGEILHLQAHVVTEKKDEDDELLRSLRSWLQSKLPQVMIPTRIFFTKSLPSTSSGKVDYLSLAASTHAEKQVPINIEEMPGDHLIQIIREVFSDALMVEKVSVDDDFFEMGGNSIRAAYVSFKLGINMKLLYTCTTPLRLQMALLSSSSSARTDASLEEDLRRPEWDMLHLPVESSVPIFHGSKHRGSLVGLDSNGNVYNPAKKLKTESNMHADLKEQTPRDSSWNPPVIHTKCSFGRCNKTIHGGQCDGSCLCGTVWSYIIPRDGKGYMQELWKVNLNSCVDASPLVVSKGSDTYLFIGSHSYRFVCIDAKSGIVLWETKLEGRVECTAAILDDFSQVVVGCYRGNIYFLNFSNGSICWSFQTNGEVKSQPVVDTSRHLVWCGSYDQNIYAIDYNSYCCIYKLPCGGSIFGSPAIDEVQEKLYVATTSGHVTALSVKDMPFNKLWKLDLGAPVFGSLSISFSTGNIICSLVDGNVIVLGTHGSIMWKAKTGGPIFAGPCTSWALPSQVLICSRDGSIYSFEEDTGMLLWKHAIGHPITSSPYVDENSQLMSATSRSSDRLVCVCDSSGGIYVLRLKSNANGGFEQNRKHVVQEFARLDLQGDIFSSPVMIGGRIFVGCRDDHVYCIKLDVE